MFLRSRSLMMVLAVAFFATPALPAAAAPVSQPAAAPMSFVYFKETGHNLSFGFRSFYEKNGGVAIFGMPLTEQFSDNGLQVQYFERARFEYHPEFSGASQIVLTRLGAQLVEGRTDDAFQWRVGQSSDTLRFFSESGHYIGGGFRQFWENRGGVNAFGYPVSEELSEVNPADGQTYTVQYFERARFEYHPEFAGTPNEVQLGLLGRQSLEARPNAAALMAPAKPVELLGQSTTGYATSARERETNIAVAAAMFNGVVIQPGQEYSFLNSGNFSEDAGFTEGYAIVGGRLEKVIGGGLCQVSTTMFRAVSNAGMQITRRQGHTYVVYFYENILGFDATVFSPYLDFRWRNTMKTPVIMTTSTDPIKATVTFQIWGSSDGRKVSYDGPHVRNVVKPSQPTWQYDPELPAGAVRQLVHGRNGMDVNYIRTITMADGTTIRNDYATHYDAWEDFYTYGKGVKPPAGVKVLAPRTVR